MPRQCPSCGDVLLIGGAALALVSLFLPWLDIGLGATRNGWQETGWLWLGVGFGYPVVILARREKPHRALSVALTFVALIAALGAWSRNRDAFRFGSSIFDWQTDANGVGVYVFLLAAALGLAGALWQWQLERHAADEAEPVS